MNVETTQLHEISQQDAGLFSADTLIENNGQLPVNAPRLKRYGFSIHGIKLLAPHEAYCELIPDFHPSPLPNAPEHVLGLINLRGNLIPIYQLANVQEKNRRRSYALLIGQVKNSAALVIDDKPRAVSLEETHETHITTETEGFPSWLKESVTDTVIVNGERWHNLNANKLFTLLAQR